jgi:hypothetical protein
MLISGQVIKSLPLIPQVKTLLLSTALTAVMGVGGFMAMRACGLLTADRAEIPSVSETVKFVQHPRVRVMTLGIP